MMAFSPVQSLKICTRPLKLSPNIREKIRFKVSPISKENINCRYEKSTNSRRQYSINTRSSKVDYLSYFVQKRKPNVQHCFSPGDISFNTPDRSELPQHINEEMKHYNLGYGAFGSVVRGSYKGERVAVKVVPKHKMSSLRNEENGLKLINLNVIRIFKIIIERERGLVVMERNFGYNIQEFLHDMCISLKAPERFRYMLDIAQALLYCHHMGILHLDVKPKNILLCLSKNICKLCDFGCSLNIDDVKLCPQEVNIGVNTVCYTDPQLFYGKLPSKKSDVYSLGITMWQLLSKEVPYDGLECHTIIFKVVSEDYRPKSVHVVATHDKKYVELYESCWKSEPDMRPNIWNVVDELEKLLAEYMNAEH